MFILVVAWKMSNFTSFSFFHVIVLYRCSVFVTQLSLLGIHSFMWWPHLVTRVAREAVIDLGGGKFCASSLASLLDDILLNFNIEIEMTKLLSRAAWSLKIKMKPKVSFALYLQNDKLLAKGQYTIEFINVSNI